MKERHLRAAGISLVVIALFLISGQSSAQNVAVGTNIGMWADMGTINAEGHVAVAQHWTVGLGGRYNNWEFKKGAEDQKQNKKRTAWLGSRFWPWHVYSGWFFGAKGQWQEYNRNIFTGQETEEGDAFGMGLSAGYSLMLSTKWNFEVGLGAWGGYKTYKTYACPTCGRIVDSGEKFFILPDELVVSFMYIF